MSTEKVEAALRAVFGDDKSTNFTRLVVKAITEDAVYAERTGGGLPRVFQKFVYEPHGTVFAFSPPVEVPEKAVTAAAARPSLSVAGQTKKPCGAFSVGNRPDKSRSRGSFSVR